MSMVNTIKYYDENATEFITGTEFADVSNLRNIFLSKIRKDGIWACASILHVERSELPHIFRLAYNALKDNGVMYASFKYGSDEVVRRCSKC